jgi:hypothetical protein
VNRYPEINSLNLEDARYALKLARANFDALTDEGKQALLPRIDALVERIRELEWPRQHAQTH